MTSSLAPSRLVPVTVTVALLGTPLLHACAPTARGGRPVPLLTESDRTPDPACTASWVAAMTARVVDGDGRPVSGALVAPCLRLGDGTGTCLAPATTAASGWAVATLEPSLRCVERMALRVVAPGPSFATTYQRLDMTPTRAVLDAPDDLVVVRTSPALSREDAGDGQTPREVALAGDVTLTLRPAGIDDPGAYGSIGLAVVPGADAPAFMHQAGEPALTLAFSPDAELLEPGRVELPAPAGLGDGAELELWVLGGLYTPLESGEVIEEGALGRFGVATVREGRVTIEALPRLGWIALVPR
jgi:hypothetical protein